MPQKCTVCTHPESFAINEALVIHKASNRGIARQFGVGDDSVQRHRRHVPELLVQASRAAEVADADLILGKLQGLEEEARVALRATKDEKDWKTFLSAIAEIREQIKLLAQVSGKLTEIQINNTQVNNYVFISPAVTEAIVAALKPYPEAGYAVSDALKELEK